MNKKLTIAMLATFCLTTLLMIPLTHSTEPYDPWVDVTGPTPGVEDGTINMRDIQYEILHFNTFGDTTKNVSVVNWPVTDQQTVFWNVSTMVGSATYNALGFGHMHLIWRVNGLVAPENVTVSVHTYIEKPGGGAQYSVEASSMVVTSDNYQGSLSFQVPGETFFFLIMFGSGTTAYANLAFYLTYA